MLVIIMCKAPVEGKVKTRLMPQYSAQQAAAIHRAMATSVIDRVSTLFEHVWIAADIPAHPFFQRFNLPVIEQGDGSLGDRMQRLLLLACEQGRGPVLFLGTDSPHMENARLQQAAEEISSHDVVVGPVEDGGYDLIALNGPYAFLFDGIAWSSELVMEQTMQAIKTAGLRACLLSTGFDIDTAADLRKARHVWRCSC